MGVQLDGNGNPLDGGSHPRESAALVDIKENNGNSALREQPPQCAVSLRCGSDGPVVLAGVQLGIEAVLLQKLAKGDFLVHGDCLPFHFCLSCRE